ncbi:MAG: NUDIX domain-containing protein [Anaerolineae bacterium]
MAPADSSYRVVAYTVTFLEDGDEVLLLERAGDRPIWAGAVTGVGGRLEPGEDILSSARREIAEETGLRVERLRLRGVIHAQSVSARPDTLLFMFGGQAPQRRVSETDEGRLLWVPKDRVADLPLPGSIRASLPRLLNGAASDGPFFAFCQYSENDASEVRFAE